MEIHNKGNTNVRPEPPCMKYDPQRKNSSKFYEFHNDFRHYIDNYRQLRDALEDAIQHSYLKNYITDLRNHKDWPSHRRKTKQSKGEEGDDDEDDNENV